MPDVEVLREVGADRCGRKVSRESRQLDLEVADDVKRWRAFEIESFQAGVEDEEVAFSQVA